MSKVKLLLLGDCQSTTDFLYRFNRAAVARAFATGTPASESAKYARDCSVSSTSAQVTTRAKMLSEVGELHCFDGKLPDGIILVYDVTSPESFEGVGQALEELMMQEEPAGCKLCVVADTGVLGFDAAIRMVSADEGRALAGRFSASFFELSTESDREVDRVVFKVVRECLALTGDGSSGGDIEEWSGNWGRSLTGKISRMFRK
ncbi:uncharacterized protein BDV14DRAFT_185798 [Aspergillus stella-maris]|uniref:uncharacterized protein n=1 Tax=Aspergillus stella-maris TaxID=1810926 RepID=UPI003CCCAF79